MAKFSLCLLFLILKHAGASFYSKCDIEGIDHWAWIGGLHLPSAINDSHSGEIIRFKTKHIKELLKVSDDRYLSGKMLNDELILYTTENFSKLVEQKHEGDIRIKLHFKCSDDREDDISVYQKILFLNRHSPVFTRKVYEYKLGMAIPEDFELTQLLPINATDIDFTNKMIYFTIDFNQDFRLGYKGVNNGKDVFATRLSSLKTIRAPYRKEFSITAIDDGTPTLNSTATLIVNVMDNVDKVRGDCNGAIGKSFNVLLLLIIIGIHV